MIVHNFFSDVLLSIVHLFENYIFNYKPFFTNPSVLSNSPAEPFIKSYQFSIGNRTYQIGDYKKSAQLEFPTALITLNGDETAFGKSAGLIGHHRIYDINEIPVLYSEETKKTIYLKEEQSMIYIGVQINCESQMQAKEIEHQIKRFLPAQKYEQIIRFKSFLEVPSWFLDEKMKPNEHTIRNLFSKLDAHTGEPIYCYSVNYKPLIKLNSVQADVTESSARSFPVTLDFSYLIQLPMWLFDSTDDKGQIERVTIGFSMGDSVEPISIRTNTDNPRKIGEHYIYPINSYIIPTDSSSITDGLITFLFPHDQNVIVELKNTRTDTELDKTQYSIENGKIYIPITDNAWNPQLNDPTMIVVSKIISEEVKVSISKMKSMFDGNVYIPKNGKAKVLGK